MGFDDYEQEEIDDEFYSLEILYEQQSALELDIKVDEGLLFKKGEKHKEKIQEISRNKRILDFLNTNITKKKRSLERMGFNKSYLNTIYKNVQQRHYHEKLILLNKTSEIICPACTYSHFDEFGKPFDVIKNDHRCYLGDILNRKECDFFEESNIITLNELNSKYKELISQLVIKQGFLNGVWIH
ncbi:MAG: hypothetical protein WC413_02240 [Candidatus Nanoarchaeia archaeon]